MPYALESLVVNRIDFVDEGSDSAAFIEVYKRKEQKNPMELSEILSKMKPEHSSVVEQAMNALQADLKKSREDLDTANADLKKSREDLEAANADLKKSREDLEAANKELGTLKQENEVLKAKPAADEADAEEEVLKAMPEAAREVYLKMRAQKEAAEEQVRKSAAEKLESEAVAKAASLKALPVEQGTLVNILKSCNQDVIDVLTAAANAIEGTTLDEVGKSREGNTSSDAWDKIEAEADKIAKRDNVTKQRAIATVIKEQPELYKEYLKDGGNE